MAVPASMARKPHHCFQGSCAEQWSIPTFLIEMTGYAMSDTRKPSACPTMRSGELSNSMTCKHAVHLVRHVGYLCMRPRTPHRGTTRDDKTMTIYPVQQLLEDSKHLQTGDDCQ